MPRSTLAKRAWFLLIIAVLAAYFYALGRAPLLGPDEPRYAQVAREMFDRGDPVTPTLGGRTWFEKPALLYWFMMAGYSVFGVSEWAARFGSACSGVLTVLFVGLLARRVERAGEGEMSGFALASAAATATTAGVILFAHGASFDIIVTMTITAALASFLASEIEADRRKRRWLLAGFYAGMGVSLLAKGLIGIVLPCGVVALYYLLRRERPRFLRLGVGWGAFITLAVAATWYAPVIARHGWHFIDEFFVQHHFARFASNRYQHWQPFYFYLYIFPLLVLPWTAFLASALSRVVRRWDEWGGVDAGARVRVFALAWVVVPVAFFTISGSKLPGYVMPAVPGAALLAAWGLMRYARGEDGAGVMRATALMLVVLAAMGAFFMHRSEGVALLSALIVSAPAMLAGALALVMARRRLMSACAIVAAALLTVILTATFALDAGARARSVRDLLRAADARGYAGVPALHSGMTERTSQFYAAGRLIYNEENGEPLRLDSAAEIAQAARAHGRSLLVITPRERVEELTAGDARLAIEPLGDNGEVALLAVRVR